MKSFLEKTYNIWKANLLSILFSSLTLVFMEWLFITTKPSFLSGTAFHEKLSVLLLSAVVVIGILLFLSLPIVICCSAFPSNKKMAACLLSIIPALTLGCSILLAVDNFTYTLFKFGIVNTLGISRALYLCAWLALLLVLFLRLSRILGEMIRKLVVFRFQKSLLPFGTVIFSCAILLLSVQLPKHIAGNGASSINIDQYPNVILFTADGVNANHMSLYGYERATTPFLDSIKEDLIIGQNHFTNSANTTGSIVSMMTGKYPMTTKVLYPPDVLIGADRFEHLPGILKGVGYYTAQFAVNHYVDQAVQNLLNGFDESNGIKEQTYLANKLLNDRIPANTKMFFNEIEKRLTTRVRHIFFIQSMENTFLQITETQKNFKDDEKVLGALELIRSKSEPVFVHIHWMGTHGSKFFPISNKYSSHIDRENQPHWDTDLYDDAIIDVDTALEKMFKELTKINELDHTIFIISSDHGQRFTVFNRVPVLIYAPDIAEKRWLLSNTQHIDIAATILDMIDVDKTGWMTEGHSFFAADRADDIIISTGTLRSENIGSGNILDEEHLDPPFYQFDFLNIIDCDRFYNLSLEGLSWSAGTIPSYVGACDEAGYASAAEIRAIAINRLMEDGFVFDQNEIPELN